VNSTRARVLALAAVLLAEPAHASTGNFMPMLGSFFIVIPALLLIPPTVIACRTAYTWQHRSRWAGFALLIGAASFATLWWAAAEHSILARQDWYIVYAWVLPSYLFWAFAAQRMKR
jgi:hypothetical protein